MPFDPLLPANQSPDSSAVMRGQLTGLFDLIQTIPVGPTGPAGVNSAVVDGVTTANPGESAASMVSLTGSTLHFSFTIPRGDVGAQGATGLTGADGGIGPTGAMGPAFTSFVVDSVTTLDPSQPASVTASFDGANVRFAFGIPRGQQGNDGGPGLTGPQGAPGEVSLAQLDTAIANTSSNSNAVAGLAGPFADPDAESLRQKLNELLAALRR
jgi:hypothetical protein